MELPHPSVPQFLARRPPPIVVASATQVKADLAMASSGCKPVKVMSQFNGQIILDLEVHCFDTVKEVKRALWNAYCRLVGEPDWQMTLDAFSAASGAFVLTLYRSRPEGVANGEDLEDDDEVLDDIDGECFLAMRSGQ